ncbi:MAG: methyl-accepting chemotaxis protein [Candidatus Vecturithrix sp.]|nr:methyl-accepting chemotaxis protein [Candidatus Vecturithrix sp.]
MWRSLRLAQKIWCGLSILLLGYCASMVLGFVLGQRTETRLYGVETSWFPAAMQSQQALSAFNNQITRYTEAVMAGDPEQLEIASQHALEVTQSLETIMALTGLPIEQQETVQKILQQFTTFTTQAQTTYAAMSSSSTNTDVLGAMTGVTQQASGLAQQTEDLRQTLETTSAEFTTLLKTEISAIQTRSKQNRYLNVVVFVVVVSLALIIISVLMRRGITRPISTLVGIAHGIANGDVNQHIQMTSHDEIGELAKAFQQMNDTIRAVLQETERVIQAIQRGDLHTSSQAASFQGSWRDLVMGMNQIREAFIAPITTTAASLRRIARGRIPTELSEDYQGDFNKMRDDLNVVIRTLSKFTLDIQDAANQVASGSRQLNESADRLSQGTSRQAATAEEVSATVEQISANIRQNAENAAQTAKVAQQSADDAQHSGEAVVQTVKAMQEIAAKIQLIEEIAQQTHMLSLNATIEAAKAEDHGRGFAVVASEVRLLAERSRIAAEEINRLANSSVTIAETAGTMLAQLVPNIESTAELIQEISAASNEQKIGVEQINLAVQQLDMVIQQNARIAEETSDTADDLLKQAEQFQKIIAFFHVDGTDEQPETQWEDFLNTLHLLPNQHARDSIMTMVEAFTSTPETREDRMYLQQQIPDEHAAEQNLHKAKKKQNPDASDFSEQSYNRFHEDSIDQEFERH